MAAIATDLSSRPDNPAVIPEIGKVDDLFTNGTAASLKDGSITEKPAVNGHSVYPKSRVDLIDRFVDEPRKLRVAVIGGGLAGILAGSLLPEKVPGIELVIYEKNPDFVSGGRTSSLPEHVSALLTPRWKGRDMVRERLPGRPLRHSITCLSVYF